MKRNINRIKMLLADDHFLSLLGNVFSSGIGALCIMVCSRFLPPAELGIWFFFLAASNLLEITKHGFINNGLIKFASGCGDRSEIQAYTGSAWLMSVLVSLFIFAGCGLILLLIPGLQDNIFYLVLLYPVYTVLYAPLSIGCAIMTATGRFGLVCIMKVSYAGFLLISILVGLFFNRTGGLDIIILQLLSIFLTTVIIMFKGWSGFTSIGRAGKEKLLTLLQFGKYSIFTFLGVSLLKSSDTFLIGLMMTNANVAIYAVPVKLIEIIEIIINSIADVALPAISKGHSQKKQIRVLFSQYTGVSLFLLIPLIIIMYLFAQYLILLFAGSTYSELSVSVNVFRIFLIYSVIMIIDRFSGVTLDAINKPKLNSYKVMVMAVINIIGDVIVIRFFHQLEYVAFVTIVNVVSGVIISAVILKKEIQLDITTILPLGFSKLKSYCKYLLHNS